MDVIGKIHRALKAVTISSSLLFAIQRLFLPVIYALHKRAKLTYTVQKRDLDSATIGRGTVFQYLRLPLHRQVAAIPIIRMLNNHSKLVVQVNDTR